MPRGSRKIDFSALTQGEIHALASFGQKVVDMAARSGITVKEAPVVPRKRRARKATTTVKEAVEAAPRAKVKVPIVRRAVVAQRAVEMVGEEE
jgi:Arc/MetJ family transcription regulator